MAVILSSTNQLLDQWSCFKELGTNLCSFCGCMAGQAVAIHEVAYVRDQLVLVGLIAVPVLGPLAGIAFAPHL